MSDLFAIRQSQNHDQGGRIIYLVADSGLLQNGSDLLSGRRRRDLRRLMVTS